MKPNIVFAFADDWGRYASAYSKFEGDNFLNALIDTPNFDRVAREGAIFKNAFVPAPSCTPCRSSVLSGSYFWQTGLGAILHGAIWDETIPTYPLELEKDGYHIGYTYKVWAPGKAQHAPYGAERTKYESAGNHYRQFSFYATEKSEEHGTEGAKQLLLDETRDNFNSFLEAREEGKPFCYWWGPTNTHRKWQKGSGKNLWNIEPDDLKGRLPGFLPDVHDIREDVGDYLGECMAFDAGLGVLLERLEEIGELDNTLVVVSGDHGIPGFPRAKCNLYDIGCEVALAARWPGHIPAGREIDDFVNLMDLAPTFMEAAGVDIPGSMTAKSLLPVLESNEGGQVDPARTFVVTGRERHVSYSNDNLPYPSTEAPDWDSLQEETYVAYPDMDASPTKAWMIHNRAKKEVQQSFDLGFGKRPQEELYDLGKDPHYMNNVADDPSYQGTKKELFDQLMAVLKEQDDPRVVETPCRFEQAPYASPFEKK